MSNTYNEQVEEINKIININYLTNQPIARFDS